MWDWLVFCWSPPLDEGDADLPESDSDSLASSEVTITVNSFQLLKDISRQSVPHTRIPSKVVYNETLGQYQRISVLTVLLLCSIILLGLTIYCLIIVLQSDYVWDAIIAEVDPMPFPQLDGVPDYFEGRKLDSLPIGKLIKHRRDWKKQGVEFGLRRSSWYLYCNTSILCAFLVLKACHFVIACFSRSVRRSFQLIAISYGFLGLILLCLSVVTLYFEFVYQVSVYLQNAYDPPDPVALGVNNANATLELFVNLCYFCAFSYSLPNEYAKSEYGIKHWTFIQNNNGMFQIGGSSFSKNDMMQLTICPKQNYITAAVVLMTVTSLFSWIAAAYSETVENRVIGPPGWLSRFQVKTKRGVRTWITSSYPPMDLKPDRKKGHHRIGKRVSSWLEDHQLIDDPYSILDGGTNHILLAGPLDLIVAASTPCLYRSRAAIDVTPDYPRVEHNKQEKS